ncbi:MAG: 50S ribosomal protein L32 [Candidatus Kapabacteria bacterium]|jgi:large subunit ribosomal protein L32|nr:50S ribosomal protein L32 [Candidatus Kapabacteria bacterium]
MAHPKRKTSKARRDKRRTHYKAVVPTTTLCPQCGGVRLAHQACPECGYYNGRKIIDSL